MLDPIAAELQEIEARGLRRALRPLVGPQGPRLRLESGEEILNLSSNDYLGLASHPALADAARAAVVEEGFGAGSARLIAGNLRAHRRLEADLAAWKHTEAALLFGSGYQANLGTLAALLGPDDVVYSDALNHASLIDGMRLSHATVRVYPHLDLATLRAQLAADAGRPYRRRLIATETVFSMDGDIAPVAPLAELARHAGALFLVDEAHATGVLGPEGRGVCAAAGVHPDVEIGTLSKGLGAYGAFVAGSRSLCELLLHRARSFVFTTALPPVVPAAAAAAVRIARSADGESLRRRLAANAAFLRDGLARAGVPVQRGETPIVPIVLGDARRTMACSEALLSRGIYAQGVRPPTVPEGGSRLRLAVSAAHEERELARAIFAIQLLLKEIS